MHDTAFYKLVPFDHRRQNSPAVQHSHLTFVSVDVLVGATDQLLLLPLAVGRAGFPARSTLLGHTERHWDFEDVFSVNTEILITDGL